MKKTFFTLLATISPLLVVSCYQDSAYMVDANVEEFGTRTAVNVKPQAINWSAPDSVFFVTEQDIQSYIAFKSREAQHNKQIFSNDVSIVPIGLADDTLCYVLNYFDGWEIIAADKRSPIPLAYSESGKFEIDSVPENIRAWVQCVEKDVSTLRCTRGKPFWVNEQIEQNVYNMYEFWHKISRYVSFASKDSLFQKSNNDPDGPGYWELDDSYTENEYHANVAPLTVTNFHQEDPYNDICPKKNLLGLKRAPAGCVAISGAQMLYFLHYKIGLPVYAASDGYCRTTINDTPNYQGIHITNSSQTIWNTMISHPSDAAYLVADVGKKVFTDYAMDGSVASTMDLKANVFELEGISCKYGSYNVDSVAASLCRGMPLIARAQDINYGGHSFIIDGYKDYESFYVEIYGWRYNNPNIPHVMIEDSISVTPISSARLLHMNWGWGESNNNGWYSATGSWNINNLHFNYYREILWDFKREN